jgi:hypothetical protein
MLTKEVGHLDIGRAYLELFYVTEEACWFRCACSFPVQFEFSSRGVASLAQPSISRQDRTSQNYGISKYHHPDD